MDIPIVILLVVVVRIVIVRVKCFNHCVGRCVEFSKHPAIKLTSLGRRAKAVSRYEIFMIKLARVFHVSCRVKSVNVGIDHKKAVDIPEP